MARCYASAYLKGSVKWPVYPLIVMKPAMQVAQQRSSSSFDVAGKIASITKRRELNLVCNSCLRRYASDVSSLMPNTEVSGGISSTSSRAVRISRQMKAYLERAKEHEDFMEQKVADYKLGQRHLANIMGADPDSFMQDDINKAIQYLLPSGLMDPRARPIMEHPEKLYPPHKAAQFDLEGRPFHTLFYTGKPNYHNIFYEIESIFQDLNEDDQKPVEADCESDEDALSLDGYEWIKKGDLEAMTLERLKDEQFDKFVSTLDRLIHHPLARRHTDFIMQFFRKLETGKGLLEDIPQPQYTAENRPFAQATGKRLKATANVTLYLNGTGEYVLNGEDVFLAKEFDAIQEREQLLFPLHFAGLLGKVDIVGMVEGSCGAKVLVGAVRLALSRAIAAFQTEEEQEMMRQAGLLTHDPRLKERKKAGQPGARKKPTWKKR